MATKRYALSISWFLSVAVFFSTVHGQSNPPTVSPSSVDVRVERALGVTTDRLEGLEKQREKLVSLREELKNTLEKQKSERQELLARQALIEGWRKVTFVLLSARTAVGIEARDASFSIQAIAHYPESEYVARIVQRFSIPCITQDDLLTEQLGRMRVGDMVPNRNLAQLNKFWCRHKYVPVGKNEPAKFVVFHDMERNASRLGYLMAVESEGLTFQAFSQSPETIRPQRIKSGSARAGDASRMKSEPGADFLDLCALRIGQQLETEENAPSFQAVALNVKVDDLEEALTLSKQLDDTWQDRWFDFVARSSQKPYIRDQRKEPTRILRDFSLGLEDQLRSRLNRLGIPLVEREEMGTIDAERELAETKHFDQRNYRKLHSATHMVIADVGRPTHNGVFRVDVRLVDVHSGGIIFEDTDDIGKPMANLASNFNVQSGQLMVMAARGERGPYVPSKQKPILLDSLATGQFPTRLVRWDKSTSTEHVYYDLFDRTRKTVPTNAVVMVSPTAGKMPRDEKLRWIAWQIFDSIVPMAGKVAAINGDRVTLNIGSNQGIKRGDLFQVMRCAQDEASEGATTVLPIEIRADEVSSNQSTGFVVDSEVSVMWSDLKLAEGDWVLRQGTSDAVVQLVSPATDFRHWQGDISRKVNGWGPNQIMRLKQKLSMFGKAWADGTTSGLQQAGLTMASENDRSTGNARVTHQVFSYISPMSANTECSQFTVRLEIKDAISGKLLQTVGPISFAEAEALEWRP